MSDKPASPGSRSACGATPQTDFANQFRRVYEAAQCRTQAELGDFFGIKQSSIADAKRRKSLPADWLVKLYTKRRINPDWIRDGASPQYLMPTPIAPFAPCASQGHCALEIRPPEDCSAQELVNELVRRALLQG